jgi:hypothetical protein
MSARIHDDAIISVMREAAARRQGWTMSKWSEVVAELVEAGQRDADAHEAPGRTAAAELNAAFRAVAATVGDAYAGVAMGGAKVDVLGRMPHADRMSLLAVLRDAHEEATRRRLPR